MSDRPGAALVHRPEDVSAEWLSSVLGIPVAAFEQEPVGTGQMGDSVRYMLMSPESMTSSAPRSVVVKFAAADETSRATGRTLRSYEIEVRYYREVAHTVGIRTPHCYFAEVDPATGWFTLVFEDLAPAVQGDQLRGCTVDQAALALEELAKLHAPRWGDPALAELEWLNRSSPETAAGTAMLIAALLPGFCQRYQDRLTADQLGLAERVVHGLPRLFAERSGPMTVTHGDYRLDNMLFGTHDGGPPLAVVDWQTAVLAPALTDASYFLGAGLVPDDRRAHEKELVRLYHEALVAGGVPDLDWEACWTSYRRYSFGGLVMAIAASGLVERTARGDDMFITMATRHAEQIADLDAEEFLR